MSLGVSLQAGANRISDARYQRVGDKLFGPRGHEAI
jgi:hypothetical protein